MTTNNSSGDLYQQIYKKLLVVVPDLQSIEESGKSIVAGFMDLNFDVLKRGTDKSVIALSHYYKQGGDMIADPDMEIAIYPARGMAEALTYQDTYLTFRRWPGAYRVNFRRCVSSYRGRRNTP